MYRLFPAGSLWSKTSANFGGHYKKCPWTLHCLGPLCFSGNLDETWTEPKFHELNLKASPLLPLCSSTASVLLSPSLLGLSVDQTQGEAPALLHRPKNSKMLSVVWCSLTLLSSEGDTVGTLWHPIQISATFTASQHLIHSQMNPHYCSPHLLRISLSEAPMTAQNHLKRSPPYTHTNKE